MFKLTHNIASSTLSHALHFAKNTNTKGYRHKLFISCFKKLVFKTYFINRIAPVWNSLLENCFYIDNLSGFKNEILSMNFKHFITVNN